MEFWSYRVFKRDGRFEIHDALYEDGDVVAWTEDPTDLAADARIDLAILVQRLTKAIVRPVLDFETGERTP